MRYIATNGKEYEICEKTKTAREVKRYDLSKESLENLRKVLKDSIKHSLKSYVEYLRQRFPDEKITVNKNRFDVRNYRFTVSEEGIKCNDLSNYSAVVHFKEFPTPKVVGDFLEPKKVEKEFTPEELSEAYNRGKEIKPTMPEPVSKKKPTEQELLKAKEKALRLINRIIKKQADSKRIFEELPKIVPFRRLNININLQIKKYKERKIRFPKLIENLQQVIQAEDFKERPTRYPLFEGGREIRLINCEAAYNELLCYNNGELINKGKLLVDIMLAKDSGATLVYYQLVKWLKKEITEAEFIDKPIKKDRFVDNEIELPQNYSLEQIDVLEEVYMKVMNLPLPYNIVYETELKKGDKIRIWNSEYPSIEKAVVVSVDQGVELSVNGGITYLLINQKYRKCSV